jgi:hypothetical protein
MEDRAMSAWVDILGQSRLRAGCFGLWVVHPTPPGGDYWYWELRAYGNGTALMSTGVLDAGADLDSVKADAAARSLEWFDGRLMDVDAAIGEVCPLCGSPRNSRKTQGNYFPMGELTLSVNPAWERGRRKSWGWKIATTVYAISLEQGDLPGRLSRDQAKLLALGLAREWIAARRSELAAALGREEQSSCASAGARRECET